MTPPPTVSSPQLTQQFLSSVLSQRGPSALPYSEDTKWLIRQHLVSLTTTYPSLEPKTSAFTHNDGRSVNLFQADGTIPMTFQGVTYNIPVVLWLMETYPRHPPCVYVNPTPDMIIKRPHSHVNPSGSVSVPYLQNWVYPSSNLVDLVRDLSTVFGRDPPLYSQRRQSVNPNLNSNFGVGGNSLGNSTPNHPPASPTVISGAGFAHPPIPPRNFPPSPYNGFGAAAAVGGRAQPPHSEDPTEVFKRNAINKLVDTVHGDIVGLKKTREAEMEGMLSAQAVLRQREERLNKGLKEMLDEKESLEQQLKMVLMNTDVLEGWLRTNDGKKVGNLENVEDAFECADVLSKQMLECAASDLAIEDIVYSLDKGVQAGAIPFEQYLRNVRSLSREQFLHRATAAKVRATQLQAQVANIAARTHYVMS